MPRGSTVRDGNRWKIRVVRVDPGKYPRYTCDRDHPFASQPVEARLAEIDAFCARLRAQLRRESKPKNDHTSAA